ncbi:MAG: YkgJ family cysteine cluster protein [Candidatus Micrarchaeota archaeon]|nr:YkgJ family cysteine cluster protein [Candidatus Micrarchaeota archaeon]
MEASPAIVNSCRFCTARCCKGLAVVLTLPEAKRLAQATGLAPEKIFEFTTSVDSRGTPHYPFLVRHSQGVAEYFLILKRRRKKECIFLEKDHRCSIYPHRPHVCRLYPFELDGKKVKKNALCPVKFPKDAEIEEAARQLQADLVEHGKMARRWHAKFGKNAPDIERFSEYFP